MRLPVLLNGPLIVNQTFCASEQPAPLASPQTDYVGEGVDPDLESLSKAIALIQNSAQGAVTSTDGDLASLLHKSLPLSRRDAANKRFWHHVAVRNIPQYVVWRWHKGGAVPRERYLGSLWRNAFARLWWLAELTYRPENADPYTLTRCATNSQEFFQWTTDILIGGNPSFVRTMTERAFGEVPLKGDEQIRKLYQTMNGFAGTHAIDVLGLDELKAIVSEHANALGE